MLEEDSVAEKGKATEKTVAKQDKGKRRSSIKNPPGVPPESPPKPPKAPSPPKIPPGPG